MNHTITFGHRLVITDTINVTVHFVNDSANLDNWYITQGLRQMVIQLIVFLKIKYIGKQVRPYSMGKLDICK